MLRPCRVNEVISPKAGSYPGSRLEACTRPWLVPSTLPQITLLPVKLYGNHGGALGTAAVFHGGSVVVTPFNSKPPVGLPHGGVPYVAATYKRLNAPGLNFEYYSNSLCLPTHPCWPGNSREPWTIPEKQI